MTPRIAKSLDTLRSQINELYSNRSKTSDGWIGDAAHASRASKHNANPQGVVTALDITHDPSNGVDTWKLAEILRQNRDPRINCVISNGRIFSSSVKPWEWRPYNGANKHAHHIHVDVLDSKADLTGKWKLDLKTATAPVPQVKPIVSHAVRLRMAKKIIDFEARRDSQKRLAVYKLPANDGGGTFEVAGINDRYHPEQANKLKNLIEAGRYEEAERSVQEYLINYTDVASGWTTSAGVEFFLRDTVFNRGPTGAAKILQRALGVPQDGQIGPTTRGAIAELKPLELLDKLRWAREDYERNVVGYRANFWKGLTNRWNNALTAAKEFEAEQSKLSPVLTQDAPLVTLWAAASYIFTDYIIPISIFAGIVLLTVWGYRYFSQDKD